MQIELIFLSFSFVQAELQMQDVKNVVVHNLSVSFAPVNGLPYSHDACILIFSSFIAQPGMVTTDLLMSGATTKQV